MNALCNSTNKTRNLACRLTAAMPAALATVGVHGPDAVQLVWSHVRLSESGLRKRHPASLSAHESPIRQVFYAHWPILSADVSEEVIICALDDQTVEVSCHGGPAVSNEILQNLSFSGCQIVDWREWSRQTHLWKSSKVNSSCSGHPLTEASGQIITGESDDSWQEISLSIRLAAERGLIEATSERTAGILLDQYNGALLHSLLEVQQSLLTEDHRQARRHVDQLLHWQDLGRHLSKPWSVVIAGPPNVGKSSLMNALAGQAHSIVHQQAGTTRDWIEVQSQIDGWPVCLTDTAGVRDTHEPIEQEGVSRARRKVADSDLVLLVVDSTIGWSHQHDAIFELCMQRPRSPRLVCVWNKIDLLPTKERLVDFQHQLCYLGESVPLTTAECCAHENVDAVWQTIAKALVPDPPPAGIAVPFSDRQILVLQQLATQLDQPNPAFVADWNALRDDY